MRMYPSMILCVTASALMAKASPLPQGSGWNTTQSGQPSCHPYQWYNPRTASCQDYASASSCGYTAQVCGDGSFCTNNNGWSQNAFDWGCCPQGYVFDYNSGSCQSFMDIVGGCGSNLAACPDRQVCSIDPLYNGYQSGQEFGQTAAPWTVSCCPDTTQWDTKLNICRDFTSADSCGPNFEACSGLDHCQMLDGQTGSINSITNFACVSPFWVGDGPGWASTWEMDKN